MACSFVMFRQVVAIALVALLVVATQGQDTCPSVFRLVNAVVPSTLSIDLLLNNNAVVTNIGYKNVSIYYQVQPGSVTISVRATGTGTIIGTRTIEAAPGVAYTVAATGTLDGDLEELLFDSSPFIFQENIVPPDPNTFKGVFHSLVENDVQATFFVESTTGTFFSVGVFDIDPKVATAYPEVPAGSYSFSVANNTFFVYANSLDEAIQVNQTLSAGQIFDLFWIGDDTNEQPSTLTVVSSNSVYDSSSGCNLIDGTSPYPSNTPISYSTGPYYCSASTIASGLAFLLAIVALLL